METRDLSEPMNFSNWNNFVNEKSHKIKNTHPNSKAHKKSYTKLHSERLVGLSWKPAHGPQKRRMSKRNKSKASKRSSQSNILTAKRTRKSMKTPQLGLTRALDLDMFSDQRMDSASLKGFPKQLAPSEQSTKRRKLKGSMRLPPKKKFTNYPNKFEEERKRKENYRKNQKAIYEKYRIRARRPNMRVTQSNYSGENKRNRSCRSRSSTSDFWTNQDKPSNKPRPRVSQKRAKSLMRGSRSNVKTRRVEPRATKESGARQGERADEDSGNLFQTMTGFADPLIFKYSKLEKRVSEEGVPMDEDILVSFMELQNKENQWRRPVREREDFHWLERQVRDLKSVQLANRIIDNFTRTPQKKRLIGRPEARDEFGMSDEYYFSVSKESHTNLKSPKTPEFGGKGRNSARKCGPEGSDRKWSPESHLKKNADNDRKSDIESFECQNRLLAMSNRKENRVDQADSDGMPESPKRASEKKAVNVPEGKFYRKFEERVFLIDNFQKKIFTLKMSEEKKRRENRSPNTREEKGKIADLILESLKAQEDSQARQREYQQFEESYRKLMESNRRPK